MTLKEEYEKQYKQTVELLKLLGRAAGVSTGLQLSAFRRTCEMAVAYGKYSRLSFDKPPADTACQQEEDNKKL